MRKLKRAIIEKYLPLWCRAELLDENRKLENTVQKQKEEIDRLNAYIDGMHDALRYRQKITINGRSDSA